MNRFLFFYLGVLFAAILLGAIAGATHHPNILTFSIVLALGAFALAGRAYDVHMAGRTRHINPEGNDK